jgi:hypothetical protein
MKKIVLMSGDVPNKLQLQHAVSRLMKDHDLLSRTKGKTDIESVRALVAVASFLDMLVRRESRNLESGELAGDILLASITDRFKTYLISLPQSEAVSVIEDMKKGLSDAQMG